MRILTLTLTLIFSTGWAENLSDKFRFELNRHLIDGYEFVVYSDRVNSIGRQIDFEFGPADYSQSMRSQHYLKIVNRHGEVLFDGATPNFYRFFVVDEHLIAVQTLAHRNSHIWIFDRFGKIIFQGLAREINQAEFKVVEQENNQETNQETSQEAGEESEKVIITSNCSSERWLNDIKKLIFDRYGRVEGFYFEKYSKLYRYTFSDYQNYHAKVWQKAISSGLLNTLNCPQGFSLSYKFNGQWISRWCENENGIKHGKFERWVLNEAFLDGQLITEEKSEGEMNFVKVVVGQYQNDNREGSWKLYYPEYGDTMTCQLVADQLDGQCVYIGKGEKQEYTFDSGMVHGTFQLFHNGGLQEECEYKNGVKNGQCLYYYNSIIPDTCNYSGLYGLGICKSYDRTGNLESECQLKGQVEHGQCVNYKNGEVIEIDYYDAGEWLLLDE